MKKILTILIMAMMFLTVVNAQNLPKTEYESLRSQPESIFSVAQSFFSTPQEFLGFPVELRRGQRFLFRSLMFTTAEAYDIKVVYEFYQGGELKDTISFPTFPEYPVDKRLPISTRFDSSIRIQLGSTKYQPGPVGVVAYLRGTKVKFLRDEVAIISTIDERQFNLIEVLDCSYNNGQCASPETGSFEIGIIDKSIEALGRCVVLDKDVIPCGPNEVCKTEDNFGVCKTLSAPKCVPQRNSDGTLKLKRIGGTCSNQNENTCGETVIQSQDGEDCGNGGTCERGRCANTCDPSQITVNEPCFSTNCKGDLMVKKPNGVSCIPSGQSSGSGYVCSDLECVSIQPLPLGGDPVVECSIKGADKGNLECCAGLNDYTVGGQTICGDKPEGVCSSDSECGPNEFCNNDGGCQTVPEAVCTNGDKETSTCKDGSKLVVAECVKGKRVETKAECPEVKEVTNKQALSGGRSSHTTSDPPMDPANPDKGSSPLLTFFIIVILAGGAAIIIRQMQKKKGKKRR